MQDAQIDTHNFAEAGQHAHAHLLRRDTPLEESKARLLIVPVFFSRPRRASQVDYWHTHLMLSNLLPSAFVGMQCFAVCARWTNQRIPISGGYDNKAHN